jgi:hypothetical protein
MALNSAERFLLLEIFAVSRPLYTFAKAPPAVRKIPQTAYRNDYFGSTTLYTSRRLIGWKPLAPAQTQLQNYKIIDH